MKIQPKNSVFNRNSNDLSSTQMESEEVLLNDSKKKMIKFGDSIMSVQNKKFIYKKLGETSLPQLSRADALFAQGSSMFSQTPQIRSPKIELPSVKKGVERHKEL